MTAPVGAIAAEARHLRLPDGRTLAYSEFGRADGEPVFYCHGSPASRLEPLLIGDEVLSRHGLRVIAADRPGIGGSDAQPGRRITDWPADMAALADALGVRRFAVLGNSGGAPYAAICAALMPERVRAAVIVSGGWRMDWPEARDGMPFVNRLVMTLARRAPWLLKLLLTSMGGVATGEHDKELAQMKRRMPPPDFEAFAVPGRLEAFGAMMREALRQGAAGPAYDLGLYMRPFGFEAHDVAMPITWFHGEQDTNAPIALARRVSGLMPAARLVTFANEAHLSTLCGQLDAIAAALRNGA
ncbi:MAG TPA: alpha/beta hydrolase [Candidatus Polarisedimenticolia bacterium]|nr:alpha/beta hydrolase [Candidatus Polarisedimenticolia bacterium]